MRRIDLSSPPRVGRAMAALLLDAAFVLVFAVVGRRSHGEEVLGGLTGTAWPFLLGLLVGWLIALAAGRSGGRSDPCSIAPAGVLIWAGTLGVGMSARALAGQGTALSFVVVAGVVLALFLLGWRAVLLVVERRRR